jgi:AMMECR1 domain-containing protein
MLLNTIISSGLRFHKRYDERVFDEIPENAFGVFVTVERSIKLKSWPEEIHGCIGNWNNDFSAMTKEELLSNAMDVSYKATWVDQRKDYFPPIHHDAYARYEIDFMLQPVYKVDDNGMIKNKKFNNKEYGIIVTGKNRRATYLPDVFPDKSWEFIKKSLLKKGEIEKDFSFFAYKVLAYSEPLYKIIDSFDLNPFKNFIHQYYKKHVPYMVGKRVHYDKTQAVRNIATIYDILQLGIADSKLKKIMINDLSQYKNTSRQALSFLILAYNKLGIEKNFIKEVCERLYNEIDELEPIFELGEVLIALNEVCPVKNILLKKQRDMYKNKKENIFQCNWESKFLYSLYKTGISKNSSNSYFHKHLNELVMKVIELSSSYNHETETNYLVVLYYFT